MRNGIALIAAIQVLIPPAASLDVQVPVAPTPVTINGRWQLAYELHITNYRTVDVVLTHLEVMTGGTDRASLERWPNPPENRRAR